MQCVGVIGFGFSGLMVVAHLVRTASSPITIYIIDETADGLGVAYRTTNPDHLLNVRAANMSAYAEDAEHFVRWLAGAEALAAMQHDGLTTRYAANDFVPRVLYGAYLQTIWRDVQAMALQKNIAIKHVPSKAVALQAGTNPAILTMRGDAIAVDAIVLAVGHEGKTILPQVHDARIIQDPWTPDALAGASSWASPVMLVGTGLTAIDAVLSLRRAGYDGQIIAVSRSAAWPTMHGEVKKLSAADAADIAAQKTLLAMVQTLQQKIAQAEDWRTVIDALRPHTSAMWQRLNTREQKRFLHKLSTLWGIHRHRMAPHIASRIAAEMAADSLRVLRSKRVDIAVKGAALQVAITHPGGVEFLQPSRIINATGLELNIAQSRNPLLRQLLAAGMVEPHANGLGVAVDPHLRAWGHAYPNLSVLGSLLTGQLLESTAVPELRVQAIDIATRLLKSGDLSAFNKI